MTHEPKNGRSLDPQRWLNEHGEYLFAFAVRHVRNADVAEDLVQETLLAAWAARDGFAGESAERTWLTAILKHKIVDSIRRTRVRSRGAAISLVTEAAHAPPAPPMAARAAAPATPTGTMGAGAPVGGASGRGTATRRRASSATVAVAVAAPTVSGAPDPSASGGVAETAGDDVRGGAAGSDPLSRVFTASGGWQREVAAWPADPARLAEDGEFWGVLQGCVDRLPERAAQAFCLRELSQLPAREIGQALGTSEANIWQLLHRARVLLRECLEANWIRRGEGPSS